MERWLWPTLAGLAVAVGVAFFAAGALADPIQSVDRPLPDLPAVTLDGTTVLDRAFFGDEPWVVTVWLPG